MEMQVIKQRDTESNDSIISIEDSLSRFRSVLLVIKFSVLAEDLCADTQKLIKQLSGSSTRDCSEIHSIVAVSPIESVYYSCTDDELSEINSDVNEPCQTIDDFYKKVTLEWIFVTINFCLELASVIFDQLSSPRKSQFALIGMVTSFLLVVICIVEIVHEGLEEEVIWERRGKICWFYHPSPSSKRFGSFKSIFGLVSAILQSIFATISYSFYYHHVNNPIKISFLPVVFAFCLLCSKFCNELDKMDGVQIV